MANTSVPGSTGLTPPVVRPEVTMAGSAERQANQGAATVPVPDPQRTVSSPHARRPSKVGKTQPVPAQRMDELKAFASREGLEVRLEQLPRNGGTVIRFVQPGTGQVVRQFPPEGVVQMLAQLRARAEGRLDQQA